MRDVEGWAEEKQDLSTKLKGWPTPWPGPPRDSLHPWLTRDDAGEGVDPDVADAFTSYAVRLAGGRRRAYNGDKR